jgi:type II secretory pathway component PulF
MSTTPPTSREPSFGLAVAGTVAHIGLILALFALYAFIVPAAKKMFDEYGMTLPWLTQEVIRLSNWIAAYWWALVPVVFLLAAADFGLLLFLSTRSRLAALVFIACVSLALTATVAATAVAIELPKAKLKEGLAR